MTPASKTPDNLNALRTEIADRFESLSPRLKQVAIYALDNPNDMALETLAIIAGHCGTQPSTVVRFAKQFGYQGASEMQRVFRDQLFNMMIGRDLVRHLQERSKQVITTPLLPACAAAASRSS